MFFGLFYPNLSPTKRGTPEVYKKSCWGSLHKRISIEPTEVLSRLILLSTFVVLDMTVDKLLFLRSVFTITIMAFCSSQLLENMCEQSQMLLNITEYSALHDFFSSTNGINWKWKNESLFGPKWNFTTCSDPCGNKKWQGLVCTTNNASISNFSLSGYGLMGTIPMSLSSFKSMANFTVFNNSLKGNFIPSVFPSTSTLKYIDLSSNFFEGNLTFTSRLSDLTSLKLSKNRFSDKFPETITVVSNLQTLDLAYNMLNGPVWTLENTFKFLTSLKTLNLGYNSFSGSVPLTALTFATKLEKLYLNENRFTGSIPSSISNFKSLGLLVLRGNRYSPK